MKTIEKAVKCSTREALIFTKKIDREGRCMLNCASRLECDKAKLEMENSTAIGNFKALKVQVNKFLVILLLLTL